MTNRVPQELLIAAGSALALIVGLPIAVGIVGAPPWAIILVAAVGVVDIVLWVALAARRHAARSRDG